MNRYLDGKRLWWLGCGVTPSESNGIDERFSGFGTPDVWPSVLTTPTLIAELGSTALDQHNNIISADPETNEAVIEDVRSILERAAKT